MIMLNITQDNRLKCAWASILLWMLFTPILARAGTYTDTVEAFNWIAPATHTNVVWTAAGGGPPNECSGNSAARDDDITQ